jgi:hypothetical protein
MYTTVKSQLLPGSKPRGLSGLNSLLPLRPYISTRGIINRELDASTHSDADNDYIHEISAPPTDSYLGRDCFDGLVPECEILGEEGALLPCTNFGSTLTFRILLLYRLASHFPHTSRLVRMQSTAYKKIPRAIFCPKFKRMTSPI